MSHRIVTDKRGVNQAYLKSVLDYNPETGVFTWKKRDKPFAYAGKEAGNVHTTNDGNTYQRITLKKANYHSHRLAWVYVNGYWPEQIDHIDGNGLNNKIGNLRNVNNRINGMNKRVISNSKTGIMGVSWCKNRSKWQVGIKVFQKKISLGRYSDFFEACCARKSAEIKYGFHPNHGRR